MKNLSKILFLLSLMFGISTTASASNQTSGYGKVECEAITGIFLQEWIEGERLLNTYVKLKDVSEPLNYTDQVFDYFEANPPKSDIDIGCLNTIEGVAIRYKNDENVPTIIQIDNDGRIQSYSETGAFQVDIVKSFKAPTSLTPKE